MEIAKLETIVADQRADLEILRYAKEPRLESMLRQLIAEADERLEQLQQEKAKNLTSLKRDVSSVGGTKQKEP